MKTRRAALYMRSSKDRAELGLDIQRKELTELAEREGCVIVQAFSDMEVSGSLDEASRPGFSALLACIKAKQCDVVLAVDTSRISRDKFVAAFFEQQCEKAGVLARYSKVSAHGETIDGEALLSMMRIFDRMHSRMSAQKGRDGQMANLAKGYRAGGRAPLGYTLKHSTTGATRGGEAVAKSQLVIDPATAPKVAAFLKARAAGVARSEAARAADLADKAVATLIGIEENALTYAGCLVWNRRRKNRPDKEDKRRTMLPRPRSEWVIHEGQHEPLISRGEADALLAAAKPKAHRVCKPRDALLTGLLVSGDQPWAYDGATASYRIGKGKRVKAAWFDRKVLQQIAHDAESAEFMAKVMNEAARQADAILDDPKVFDQQLRTVSGQIKRLVDAIASGGNLGPVRDRLAELEAERERLAGERAQCAIRASQKSALRNFDADRVRKVLSLLAIGAGEGVMSEECKVSMRSRLSTLLERVSVDADTRELRLAYRLTGAKLASPRGFEPRFIP